MRFITGNRLLEIHYLDEDVFKSYSDVQLISIENKIIPANRLALASCSSFLHELFVDIVDSSVEADQLVVSTNLSTESLQMIVDFTTKGLLPVVAGSDKFVTKMDPQLVKDLLVFGVDLNGLELEVVEIDLTDDLHDDDNEKRKKSESANDQRRYVNLDWDILGAAWESIGGLDSNQTTSVEVVTSEGESQQIIIQTTDATAGFLADLSTGSANENYLDTSDHPDDHVGRTISVGKGDNSDYVADSAKMRRVLNTSKMFPHERTLTLVTSSKPRGRPRKTGSEFVKRRGRPPKTSTASARKEDEKENSLKKEADVIERPGRRTVKRPKHFDELVDPTKYEDEEDDMLSDMEDIGGLAEEAEADLDADFGTSSSTTATRTRKSGAGRPKAKRARTSGGEATGSSTSIRWITCVACGKICKSAYLFKVHQKNFGPYHDNSCALCSEVFLTWEGHIAHLREKHNGEYKYKCGLCPEIFETEERQRIHRHEAHTKKDKDKTACDKCGKVVIDYVAHQENFHGTEEHPCPHCSRIFGHAMALKRHIKDNHRQFPCEHCGNIMKNFKKYRLHILSVHTPDNLKPYQCQICGRGFPTKWNLFEHSNKHTNDKPFQCRYCPSAFSTTSSRCHHEKACSGANRAK